MKNNIMQHLFLAMVFSILLTSCNDNLLSVGTESRMMTVYTGPPRIKTFSIKNLNDSTTRMRIEVEGDNVELGSFYVRQNPPVVGPILPNFYLNTNGYRYLYGESIPVKDLNLADNGIRDEDSTVNVFTYTFDPRDFVDTIKYFFQAGWHNRPQIGPYEHDSRFFTLLGGKIDTLVSENILNAKHRVVYKVDGIYAAFPSLYTYNDSILITSFSTRVNRSHIDPEGGSKRLMSFDNGITWSNASSINYDQVWTTTGTNLVLPDVQGWIYVSDTLRDSLITEKRIINEVKPGTIAYIGGTVIKRSTNNGTSWTTTSLALPTDCSGLYNHHIKASYIVTTGGTRLRIVYGRRKVNFNNALKDEAYLMRSTDNGVTWSTFPMLSSGVSGLEVQGFNESSIVQAANGKIIALMRSVPEGYLWKSESADDGLTWSTPVKTTMWGFPPHVIKLEDGRLLSTYGYRRAPMGIRAAVSSDNGVTWSTSNEMIIRNDGLGSGGDLGYPLVRQLTDGSIFCIYYLTTDGMNTHIATTHFEIP
ncbi:sialidase family protein [Sphingobacterium faecale]|uniref:Exo-alpha-sialidase n=1 Tax=Sphingobacterium faecale TaxID=2803775 RepID=A0ABS1R535_9SPHI|nr:sialidase family protein [Sphingobacterium faecale]MBL1409405.1 exo-alpha-sialidase [Sphingobacterium faecale]